MKKIITCLAAGLLFVGAQSLLAQSTTNSTPPAKHEALTPEQRKEQMASLLKALGLTQEDVKGLSREDRTAKMKEAANKVVADLQAKKANGALSDEDQARLTKVQNFLARGGHHKPAAAPSNN